LASFFLEIGIIIFLAFIGSYLAGRAKLSAIVGYIVVGILIGPYMSFQLFGLRYNGLITNMDFVRQISRLGLMFLLFFTGLGFSVTALRSTWKPAILLAVADVLINLYVGFIIGSLFGWPLPDTLFLAAIIGMSSVAVAAKSAEEGKQLYRKEYTYLFSTMIVEDFISILLLTFASAFVLGNILKPEQVLNMGFGVVIIYLFFFVLALYIAPKAFHYFERIQGNELFVLFALSVVFLSAAFADSLGITPAIGAFLVGMAFAETSLKDKLERQMLSMKDAFVAIFFVTFGMLVNPGMFWTVAPMVALAVPLVIMNEVFILGALAYLVGFTRRAAISIGAGFLGRGEDAVLFASVGAGLSHPDTGKPVLARAGEIGPFTGIFCFAMSIITPLMMRVSIRLADATGNVLPDFVKFAGNLVSRVLKGTIMAAGFSPNGSEKRLLVGLLSYGASICITLVTPGQLHLLASAFSLALLLLVWWGLWGYLAPRAEAIDLQDLDVLRPDQAAVRRFVTGVLMLLLSLLFVAAFVWRYNWHVAIVITVAIIACLFISMRHIFLTLKVRAPPMSKEHILPTGKPQPVREPLEFEPRKERLRVQQPTRKRADPRTYRPVPKDLLLPGSQPRR
jgi:CPA2 family monovalent cation:H+ antiporter-2